MKPNGSFLIFLDVPSKQRDSVAGSAYRAFETQGWKPRVVVTMNGDSRRRRERSYISKSYRPGTLEQFLLGNISFVDFWKGSRWISVSRGAPGEPSVSFAAAPSFFEGIEPFPEMRAIFERLLLPKQTRVVGDVGLSRGTSLKGRTGLSKGFSLYWIDQVTSKEFRAVQLAIPETRDRVLRVIGRRYVVQMWDYPYRRIPRESLERSLRRAWEVVRRHQRIPHS